MKPVRPVLRAVKKLPFNSIQFPQFELPPNVTWKAPLPPIPGFEKFYSESVRSVLCLPNHWNTFESELKVKDQVVGKFLLSSEENPIQQGYFNTGVTFTLFTNSDPHQLEFIGESIRQNTIREIGAKLGGSTEWIKYGDSTTICSLRYSFKAPEMRFGDRKASSEEMLFVQDLVVEKKRGFVFLMKFETPKAKFSAPMEETFRNIKTSGFYVVDRSEQADSSDENGLVFLEL
jgi:hypothetical protein